MVMSLKHQPLQRTFIFCTHMMVMYDPSTSIMGGAFFYFMHSEQFKESTIDYILYIYKYI